MFSKNLFAILTIIALSFSSCISFADDEPVPPAPATIVLPDGNTVSHFNLDNGVEVQQISPPADEAVVEEGSETPSEDVPSTQ